MLLYKPARLGDLRATRRGTHPARCGVLTLESPSPNKSFPRTKGHPADLVDAAKGVEVQFFGRVERNPFAQALLVLARHERHAHRRKFLAQERLSAGPTVL